MSAVTLTAADQIARARAVLCTVKDMDWPEGREARRPLVHAFIALGDAIDLHDCLADVTDEPEQAALDRAAEDAADAAELLMEAAAKCCGGETAALVRGRDGGN